MVDRVLKPEVDGRKPPITSHNINDLDQPSIDSMKPKMVYCSDQADIVSIEAGLNAHKTTPAVEKIIDI